MTSRIKKVFLVFSLTLCMCGIFTVFAKAMTVSPYAGATTTLAKVNVVAWYNSGYKTKASDVKYGVKKNAYIGQCWVRIKEGSYNKKVWSRAYTKAQKGQGVARLSCANNPFYVATATWGWMYN